MPSSAEALSRRPVSRIVAAVQPIDAPVFVLGSDGTWRDVGGGLAGAGEQLPRLTSTSVSPDARRLALVHSDGVLLVDATTGQSRLLPVPEVFGRVDNLRWLPDGNQIAVSGDLGSGVVSTSDGRFESTAEPMQDLAVSRPGDPVVHLGRSELVVENAGTTVRSTYGTGGQIVLDQWYGGGWVNGSSAASTGFLGGAGHDGEQAILVVDVGNARVTHLMTLPTGRPPAVRSNGCCDTLGWLDQHTVLLRDGGQVLAWRFMSGAVYRIARLPGTSAQGTDSASNTVIALAEA